MLKISFDLEKARLNGLFGIAILALLLISCIALSVILLHNPHKELHQAIFSTADRVHTYYRDRPGYWKLSTQTAKDDNLLRNDLQQYKDYDIQIGQGVNGDSGLPSDLSFDITIKNLNKSACISLSEMPLEKHDKLILMKITIINDKNNIEFSWGGEHKLPIAKYSSRAFCTASGNTIMWTFQ